MSWATAAGIMRILERVSRDNIGYGLRCEAGEVLTTFVMEGDSLYGTSELAYLYQSVVEVISSTGRVQNSGV